MAEDGKFPRDRSARIAGIPGELGSLKEIFKQFPRLKFMGAILREMGYNGFVPAR
jgi:hypothetical protein